MCAYVLPILYSGCILECRDKPTSHCLTNFYTHGNNLIPISVLKMLVHIVLFCLARTVKLRCFTQSREHHCNNFIQEKRTDVDCFWHASKGKATSSFERFLADIRCALVMEDPNVPMRNFWLIKPVWH